MDDLNTGHLKVLYSDVYIIQMFVIQIPNIYCLAKLSITIQEKPSISMAESSMIVVVCLVFRSWLEYLAKNLTFQAMI